MTKQEMLSELFIFKKFDNGIERIVYADKYINAKDGTVEHDLYETVSDIAHDSDMSFGFSYDVMSIACDIVAELDLESDNDDGIHEAVDNAIPVYTHDLMQIYANDSWAVDAAQQEMGVPERTTSVERAQLGWYMLIERAVQELVNAIKE